MKRFLHIMGITNQVKKSKSEIDKTIVMWFSEELKDLLTFITMITFLTNSERTIIMKRMFKKTLATVIAVATMAVGMGGMSASATSVGSDSKAASPRGTIYGDIDLSWYSPAGGVNVYTITATTSVSGVTGSYTLHTKLDLNNYPSGSLRQSATEGSSSTSVSGGYSYGNKGRAYSTHEVRGSSTGVLYLESSIMNV